MIARSPLAPDGFPRIPSIAGLRIVGKATGLKKNGKRDLFMAELSPGSTIAGCIYALALLLCTCCLVPRGVKGRKSACYRC